VRGAPRSAVHNGEQKISFLCGFFSFFFFFSAFVLKRNSAISAAPCTCTHTQEQYYIYFYVIDVCIHCVWDWVRRPVKTGNKSAMCAASVFRMGTRRKGENIFHVLLLLSSFFFFFLPLSKISIFFRLNGGPRVWDEAFYLLTESICPYTFYVWKYNTRFEIM
jgi:hypothetical protein